MFPDFVEHLRLRHLLMIAVTVYTFDGEWKKKFSIVSELPILSILFVVLDGISG
jgi:hypothetical protein